MRSLCFLALVLGAVACADASPEEEEIDEQEAGWTAHSANDEGASTHLFIVNRAIDLLEKRSELPRAKRIVSVMNDAQCRTEWQQGLVDADYKAVYNNGAADLTPDGGKAQWLAALPSFKSHFYDPDTELNYKGERFPTARTESRTHVVNWSKERAKSPKGSCYELGLALHYMTDATQPVHAANFTNTDRAIALHSHLEHYALDNQNRFVATDETMLDFAEPSTETALIDGAKIAKNIWGRTLEAVYAAYWNSGLACKAAYYAWTYDVKRCWEGDRAVDALIREALINAQNRTAEWLYAASSLLP
jgi:phospholipase C